MSLSARAARLTGCYTTVPTQFKDEPGFPLNRDGMRQHVRFLLDGGLKEGTGVLLAGGAAGDFSTLTFDERVAVAETVVEAAEGRIPVAMGGQTTSTLELERLVKAAERIGCTYVQVSPPFYFGHTEGDFLEYVQAAANAADVGLIIYNTYWTATGVTEGMVEKLALIPNVDSLKWSAGEGMQLAFEGVIQRFSDRFAIIDNQCRFVISHMLGARSIEIHIANHWPQWAVALWQQLERREYETAQKGIMDVLYPYMRLWDEMETFTSGDGYMDKLCMELVGLPSSRCRPPTRDVRPQFREKARRMLLDTGVPNVVRG